MASNVNPNPATSRGLSLYANLLKPAPGTITGAPVLYKHSATEDAQQDESAPKLPINAAALRFQPTKRPQLSTQKPKPKQNLTKPVVADSNPSDKAADISQPPAAPVVRSTLADWTADDEDVNGFYAGEKRQRGGRKKRKKNVVEKPAAVDWDEIYDPSRPSNYWEYIGSEEQMRERREWKDKLYAHRRERARRRSSSDLSDNGASRDKAASNARFAPPPNYSFAPPPIASNAPNISASPPPPAEMPDDPTGEDAYARRLRLTGLQQPPSPPQVENLAPYSPPPAPDTPALGAQGLASSTEASVSKPSAAPTPSATISRAPVRYNLPAAPTDIPATETELQDAIDQEVEDLEASSEHAEPAQRSLRPGQKGFAERLMTKYGWTKGTGLGASGTGIVNPLRVQVEKRKQKSDAEGGGFVGPAGTGKIIGGKKKGGDDEGKFGPMSEVIVLRGMVDGMDLDAELVDGDGGLMQEIGEECGEKYGRVERVFIDRSSNGSIPVFVKFTSQLSALRAVNALEGRIYNGNPIYAKFFDADKFEKGIYE